jgi:hypothetical protein
MSFVFAREPTNELNEMVLEKIPCSHGDLQHAIFHASHEHRHKALVSACHAGNTQAVKYLLITGMDVPPAAENVASTREIKDLLKHAKHASKRCR